MSVPILTGKLTKANEREAPELIVTESPPAPTLKTEATAWH
jgi:hypothetical protein